jgi:hypothetical protein
VLRRYSQDTNTKLHLIAQRLIDTRALPGQRHPTTLPGPTSHPAHTLDGKASKAGQDGQAGRDGKVDRRGS